MQKSILKWGKFDYQHFVRFLDSVLYSSQNEFRVPSVLLAANFFSGRLSKFRSFRFVKELSVYDMMTTSDASRKKSYVNIMRKGDHASNQHFLYFQQCYLPYESQIQCFKYYLSSTELNASKLDKAKCLSLGKGLKPELLLCCCCFNSLKTDILFYLL